MAHYPTSSSFGNVLSAVTAGQVLTSNGTGSTYTTSWTPPNHNFVSNNGTPLMTIPANSNEVVLEKTATLEVKGTVKINGIDLEERLKTIEKVLLIPERDATMEAKYPSLKKKYDEYINLLGKYRTFEAIKGEDNGTK
jgi:hypothetical protein